MTSPLLTLAKISSVPVNIRDVSWHFIVEVWVPSQVSKNKACLPQLARPRQKVPDVAPAQHGDAEQHDRPVEDERRDFQVRRRKKNCQMAPCRTIMLGVFQVNGKVSKDHSQDGVACGGFDQWQPVLARPHRAAEKHNRRIQTHTISDDWVRRRQQHF